MTTRKILTIMFMAASLSACSSATMREPAFVSNDVLTDANGMTLYTFDKDTTGKSMCNGQCAMNWPALRPMKDAMPYKDYSIIMRDDGTQQWAYKDKPLYTWVKDKMPGDKTGDGFNNVWRVAKP